MKRLVFQINVPNHVQTVKLKAYTYMQDMYVISERNARAYAKKYGADYYLLNKADDYKPAAGKHLDFQKLKMFDFTEYDQILYMDSDFIIKDNAPDIFEICGKKFAAVTDYGKAVPGLAAELNMPPEAYFNAGFMCVPQKVLNRTREFVPEYLKHEYRFDGQGLLNKLFYDRNVKRLELKGSEWNPVKMTFGLYADHYAGQKKRKWGTVNY